MNRKTIFFLVAFVALSLTVTKAVDMSGFYDIDANFTSSSVEARQFKSLKDACDALKSSTIKGNVSFRVWTDLTETATCTLVNTTTYSITFRTKIGQPRRKITFTNGTGASGNAGFLIGGAGSTAEYARNITLGDLNFESSTHESVIRIIGESKNIFMEYFKIENKRTAGNVWGIDLAANARMPRNIRIEDGEIFTTTGSNPTCINFAGSTLADATRAAGIAIRRITFKTANRGIFVNNISNASSETTGRPGYISCCINNVGLEIAENTFEIDAPSGNIAYGVQGYTGFSNNTVIYIVGNRFTKLKATIIAGAGFKQQIIRVKTVAENPPAGDFGYVVDQNTPHPGVRAICTAGGTNGVAWYIDNNYFSGFEKGGTAAEPLNLTGIFVGIMYNTVASRVYIRHNTFYLNKLDNPTSNVITPFASDGVYCAVNCGMVETSTARRMPVIANNLCIFGETASPNFFVRANVQTIGTALTDSPFHLPTINNMYYDMDAAGNNRRGATGNLANDTAQVISTNWSIGATNGSIYSCTPVVWTNSVSVKKLIGNPWHPFSKTGRPTTATLTSLAAPNHQSNSMIKHSATAPSWDNAFLYSNPQKALSGIPFPAALSNGTGTYNVPVATTTMTGAAGVVSSDGRWATRATTGNVTAGAFQIGGAAPTLTGIDNAVVSSDGIRIICHGNQISIINEDDAMIQSAKLVSLQGKTLNSMQGVASRVYALTAPGTGVYVVEIQTENGRFVKKVLVK